MMRKHYYIVDGYQPWTELDEKKLDALMPNGFIGNVTEKLMEKGYILNINDMVFYAPDGNKVCRFCNVQ